MNREKERIESQLHAKKKNKYLLMAGVTTLTAGLTLLLSPANEGTLDVRNMKDQIITIALLGGIGLGILSTLLLTREQRILENKLQNFK